MAYRKQSKRARNWRSSKANQMFRYERNFRKLEDLFWLQKEVRRKVNEAKENNESEIVQVIVSLEDGPDVPVDEPEKWLEVIGQTMKYFEESDKLVSDVLNRRYVRNEGFPVSCCELEISDNKYYRARDAGLQYARECAIQLGLLKAF